MNPVDVLAEVFGASGEHAEARVQAPFAGRGVTWDAIAAHQGAKPAEWAEVLALLEAIQKDEGWGYVYVIRGTHQGVERMKIGKSNNLADRLRLFSVKLPFDIQTVSAFFVPQPLRLERELHLLMKDRRISGEWFSLDAAALRKVQWAGFSAESAGWAGCFERIVTARESAQAMPDAEYIEYLEALLAMNQIPFQRGRP